jgi:hypothetical protein
MGWLDDLTLSTVVVHLTDGQSMKGLKAAVYDDCIVLRDAMMLAEEGNFLLDGLIPIPRERVLFMQMVEAVA